MADVHIFQEADYRFGTGTLTIRVDHINWDKPDLYDGEFWYPVEGLQLSTIGVEIGQRQVMIRGRCLRALGR
ncbi:hypothetical protein GCM10010399_73910 [Dactylosporangium fulvum]|uniref:Uncharacterized protein n=1 Tax=Dactylosporangium fulvum TaxID=53359 RepID=A0ABY5VNK5_9ACTN|nr:hypothetical protein [Dactylosporangium fulvum]UWP79308.1 hypothetical protein Dfulv_29575 [Dactylosporangium fulvum]